MKGIITLLLLFSVLASTVTSATYSIEVFYPHNAIIGQELTVTFSLFTSEINSTDFQYVTPGTKIVNVSGMTAYEGFCCFFLVDKVNISNASEVIVTFYGKVVGDFTGNPGIVLYGSNFDVSSRDGQVGTYEVLVAWSGILWLDKLNGWYSVISTLPTFTSGVYKVVFKNVNNSVCVYSISVNSSTYLVEYNTGIPWRNISYVGVRTDVDTVLPLGFSILAVVNDAYYVVYLNGKEYASGYTTNGYGAVSLTIYGPVTLNITFPQYHVYKVITIPSSPGANVHETFPTLQVMVIVITTAYLAISIWKEMKKKS